MVFFPFLKFLIAHSATLDWKLVIGDQQPASLARRSATQRLHKQAIQNWKDSNLRAWLTAAVFETRGHQHSPAFQKPEYVRRWGVSEPYASAIRTGLCRPHERHWQALADWRVSCQEYRIVKMQHN